jgi:hypothetical protein
MMPSRRVLRANQKTSYSPNTRLVRARLGHIDLQVVMEVQPTRPAQPQGVAACDTS